MASDAHLRLCRLLLRQSDRHPIRTLSGEDLVGHDPRAVRTFEQLGLIVRQRDLRDAGDVVFHPDGSGAYVATHLEEIDMETAAPMAVSSYRIIFPEIARLLRTGLDGPPIEYLTHRIVALGARGKGARRRSFYLVRSLRADRALEVLMTAQAHAGPEAKVVVLLLTRKELSRAVLKQVEALQIHVVSELLRGTDSPFAINLPAPSPSAEPALKPIRLFIDGSGHVAVLDDVELSLEPRDFAVLQLLANEARDQGGFVARELIGQALREATGREDSYEEQGGKSISRIRMVILTVAPDVLLETKRKVGYRLKMAKEAIRVI